MPPAHNGMTTARQKQKVNPCQMAAGFTTSSLPRPTLEDSMRKLRINNLVLVTVVTLLPFAGKADDDTNRLTFSARFGFNISAKFKPFTAPIQPGVPRIAPDGQP